MAVHVSQKRISDDKIFQEYKISDIHSDGHNRNGEQEK